MKMHFSMLAECLALMVAAGNGSAWGAARGPSATESYYEYSPAEELRVGPPGELILFAQHEQGNDPVPYNNVAIPPLPDAQVGMVFEVEMRSRTEVLWHANAGMFLNLQWGYDIWIIGSLDGVFDGDGDKFQSPPLRLPIGSFSDIIHGRQAILQFTIVDEAQAQRIRDGTATVDLVINHALRWHASGGTFANPLKDLNVYAKVISP